MQIGAIRFASPFLLAPLAGVGDSPFRRLAREQGAAGVVSEMVSADGLTRGQRATLALCRFGPEERPIGVQVFGSDPAVMADAARRLCDMPERDRPDWIDVNAGCPVRKVVNRRAGAALLTDLPRLAAIVRGMVTASTVPVTVKTRLGWDDPSSDVAGLARAMEDAGAAALTVHARTRAGQFGGAPRWEGIAEARRAVRVPVIGNGDVRTPADAARMLEMTGCDGVMVGRGALGDPWVFARLLAWWERGELLSPPSPAARIGMARRHLRLAAEAAPGGSAAETAAREMRKHVAWYVRGLPHSARVREQVNGARTVQDVEALLIAYLGELEADPEPRPPGTRPPEDSLAAG
jgi:tRNA-dihydrouridine synthase B